MADANTEVQELFRRWRETGLSPEEVCKESPELLAALKTRIAQRAAGDEEVETVGISEMDPANATSIIDGHGKIPNIEGYTLLKKIAEGGQGAVYQAVQQSPHRKVAIKVLLQSPYSSKSAQHRFDREIDLVANLRHPHIVAVFACGKTSDGHLYYVMDYVRGLPLTEYVRKNKLPLERTLELFSRICEAVNHAHKKGIMHRDLKPANILVDADESPRILDFGMAKQLTERYESIISITGSILGTLPYMSPEQTKGNPDLVDIRTDVYALGVILYELLTGSYPYLVVGPMADVLNHIVNTAPKPLTRSWIDGMGVSTSTRRRKAKCPIDDDLETIALKALSKERERRYQSAGELGRDLQHYLKDEPIEAKRDRGVHLFRKTLSKHRAAAGAAAFLVIAAFVVWIVINQASQRTGPFDTASKARASANTQEAIQQNPENLAKTAATGPYDPEAAVLASLMDLAKFERFPLAPPGDRKNDLTLFEALAARHALERLRGVIGRDRRLLYLIAPKQEYLDKLQGFLTALPADNAPLTVSFSVDKTARQQEISALYSYMVVSQGGKQLHDITLNSLRPEPCLVEYPGADLTLAFRELLASPTRKTETIAGPWVPFRLIKSPNVKSVTRDPTGTKWDLEYVDLDSASKPLSSFWIHLEFKTPIPDLKDWPVPPTKLAN